MLSKLTAYGAFIIGALSVQVTFENPAHADVDIYHGVGLSNANTGRANLSNGEFTYRGGGVSNFDADNIGNNNNKPCLFRFTAVVDGDPAVDETYDLSGPDGYQVEYDNDPVGHWNILLPANTAANAARNALSSWARDNRDGRVSNGTRDADPACN